MPQGIPVSKTYALRNVGFDTLDISGIASSHPAFRVLAAPASILPGATATFSVEFTPSDSLLDYQADITVSSSDCGHPVQSFAVSGGKVPGVEGTVAAPLCHGGTGSIALAWPAGAYSVVWNTGDTAAVLQDLPAGLYVASLTDSEGRGFEVPVTLSEPDPLQAYIVEMQAVGCDCGTDGELRLEAQGGSGPYAYQWSHGITGDLASGLTAQAYTATVTDANGCLDTVAWVLGYDCAGAGDRALHFDGQDDFVGIGTSIPQGGQRTYEAWFRAETFPANPYEGSIVTSELSNAGWAIRAGGNGQVEAVLYDMDLAGFASILSPENTIQQGQWHHVALVIANDAILYVDGAWIGTLRIDRHRPSSGEILVGNTASVSGRFWHGEIDEVRIWGEERLPADILAYKDVRLTGSEPGLLAYFDFDQGTPNGNNAGTDVLFDRTANGRNGQLQGFALSGNASNWVLGASGESGNPTFGALEVAVGDAGFGMVAPGTSLSRTFMLRNVGFGPLQVSEIRSSNPRFVVHSAISSIEAGDSAALEVVFSPENTLADSASITIASLDCDEPTLSFLLFGNDPPVATISAVASTVSGPFSIDIAFSEPVQGLLPIDFAIGNAAYSQAEAIDASHYRLTLAPRTGGYVTVSLPEGQAQSIASGQGNRASNLLSVYFDGLVETCLPQAGSTRNGWIRRIRVLEGTESLLDHTSGNNGGYAQFDGLGAVPMAAGGVYALAIHRGVRLGEESRQHAYKVWIDYNRDGDFGDEGEMVFARGLTSLASVRASINVPANAMPGLARMRVQLKHAQVPFGFCEAIAEGETEDYLVRIEAHTAPLASKVAQHRAKDMVEGLGDAISIHPNPASSMAQVRLVRGGIAFVEIFAMDGRRVWQEAGAGAVHGLDLSGLPSGLYVVAVTDVGGARHTAKLAVGQ
jgi:hypothetical protein